VNFVKRSVHENAIRGEVEKAGSVVCENLKVEEEWDERSIVVCEI